MKKVLIFAYRFPPFGGTSATRIASFTKYLPEFGWEPTIVTSDWTEFNCEQYDREYGDRLAQYVEGRVPLHDIRRPAATKNRISRLAGMVKREVNKRRNTLGWTRQAIKIADQLVSREPGFDAILATSPPFSALRAASQTASKHGIPWVADFRDVFEEYLPRKLWPIQSRIEQSTLKSTASILTVSQPLADTLQRRHKKPVQVLPNGFDPEDFEAAHEQYRIQENQLDSDDSKFRFVYTGMIYPKGHPARVSPRPLLEAVDQLLASKEIDLADIQIDLIGTPAIKVESHLTGLECRSVIRIIPWVDRNESYLRQIGATVLVLLGSAEMKGILTAKFFEYLAARRPILSLPGGSGQLNQLLEAANAGTSATTVAECRSAVLKWYQQWKQQGALDNVPQNDQINQYSRKMQTQMLSEILSTVAKSPRS